MYFEIYSTWISLKDKLPEFEEYVLATDGEFQWVAIRFKMNDIEHFNSYICTCCNSESTFKATHWMRLPKLPTKDKLKGD